jgi:hypothetical protein
LRWHLDIVGCTLWVFGMVAFCLTLQGMAAACLALGIVILLPNGWSKGYPE